MATPVDAQTEVPVDNDHQQNENVPSSPQGVAGSTNQQSEQHDDNRSSSSSPRPLRIYTRAQLLALSKSPLICVPPEMPELKEWFGAENEQNLSKKDSEPSTPNSGRERRFRRDADESELPARPSFRSSLSQPSQMGNFKHQSLRSTDRDGDRDGQERLRNLSDKFDRDRLGLPPAALRTNKERDIAPHLASGPSRISAQSQGTIAARRAETREAAKKKVGESSEDWRRGAEPRRPEWNRAESDAPERPRSRSRRRRDPSASRRDREETRKEREREREDFKRDRDRDREDDDDSRRWRDDGRRDERITARRERERGAKDKESGSSNPNDRRWTLVEERDARSKRNPGRDKKAAAEENRVDDRRGDREKEKEPAWMDTYIPTSSSSGGILGGKGGDGELDGIQAWKKNMKEKEQKGSKAAAAETSNGGSAKATADVQEAPMDEIQRFKKMMEMAQKQTPDSPPGVGPILGPTETTKLSSAAQDKNSGPARSSNSGDLDAPVVASSVSDTLSSDPSRSLLSLLNSNAHATSNPSPSTNADSSLLASTKLHSRLPLADGTGERNSSDAPSSQFNPPQGSRLLALGNRAPAKPSPVNPQGVSSPAPNGGLPTSTPNSQLSNLANSGSLLPESFPKGTARTPSNFSPFEEQRELGDALRRSAGERTPYGLDSGSWPDSSPLDSTTAGHAIGKGSRFAKFFDGKGKETPVAMPIIPKAPTPVDYSSTSPGPHARPDSGFGNLSSSNLEHRSVNDLFAKLNMNNSLQGQRGVPNSAPLNHGPFGQQSQNQLHSLQQQQQQLHSQNQLQNAARLEPLYESRNFMPDNLVPGLRSAPPPRSRENGGLFPDSLDETLLLSSQQRIPVQQQHRAADNMYAGGSIPAGYAQQHVGRNGGIPVQGPHFRGGPSPVSAQHTALHNAQQQQRLPPGLANLGARPPHDPAQFGMPGPLHNGLHIGGPPQPQQQQQAFNNFHPAAGFGVPQGQLRPPAHQLQNAVNHHQLGNLGHPGNLDVRNVSQAQLLAMSGLGGNGMRNASSGAFNHQQQGSSLQNPVLAMRQQHPTQQLHPHMMPHLLPPHLSQAPPVPNSQSTSAQDLMALLMGNHHRD